MPTPDGESDRRKHLPQQRTRTAQLLMHETRGRPARTDQSTDRLGRFLALVLRHKPDSVGITLDPAGFLEVAVLAQAIAAQPGWASVTADAIRAVTQKDAKRFLPSLANGLPRAGSATHVLARLVDERRAGT